MASIKSKQQLEFYLKADRMMNRGAFKYSFKQKLMYYLLPDYIMQYLEALRKYSYYANGGGILYCEHITELKRIDLV